MSNVVFLTRMDFANNFIKKIVINKCFHVYETFYAMDSKSVAYKNFKYLNDICIFNNKNKNHYISTFFYYCWHLLEN